MLYIFGEYELDTDRYEFRVRGQLRHLQPQVYLLIHYLVENRDRLVSRDELIAIVWKRRFVSESTIDARINAARKAMDDDGRRQTRIKTVSRRGYRFIADVEIVYCNGATVARNGVAGDKPHSPVEKPSIAVLPFANLSGDEGQEYIADGMTEEITTSLSRFRSLFVIARSSTFAYKGKSPDVREVARNLGVRYVLEGSARKGGNRVRISAQLIDATSANHLWADHFDRRLDDIFDLQDQITEQIVVSVEPEIHTHERERARRKPPDSLGAWELLQRGLAHFYRVNKTDRAEAIRLFKKAVALDPEFAAAHAHLAYALSASGMLGYAEDTARAVAAVRAAAEQAVSLDPNEPMGHYALGRAHIVAGEIEMAIGEMQNAISINPNFPRGHYGLGFAHHFGAGQAEQALPYYDAALRLSPRDPTRWVTLMLKGSALRFLRRHQEAIAHCRQACLFPRAGFQPHMHLAAALAEAGQIEKAKAAVGKATQLEPALSISYIRSHFLGMHETILKNMLVSLRKAGIPE